MNIEGYTAPYLQAFNLGTVTKQPGRDGFFKKTQLPSLLEYNLSNYVTDPDLKKLEDAMIKDNYVHRHQCFWKDNTAQSFAYLTISVIKGEGLSAHIEGNDKANKIIDSWNEEINVKHEHIGDLVSVAWLDNLMNAGSLFRIYIDKNEEKNKVDVQRVSLKDVFIQEHPTRGWRRFIQKVNVPSQVMAKTVFYRSDPLLSIKSEMAHVIIPDEPETCMYFKFFESPPVSSVMHLMVYKRWITWFMRKFAEKYWAPFIIGYVGDPANGYMPTNKKDMDDSLSFVANALRKIRDFGVGAFPATMKIETLDTKTAKNAEVYTNYLEYLNKEIAFGILSSMALREASGREAATSDIVQQGYLRFIRGIREEIAGVLKKFYSRVLLPAYGINNVEAIDIKITWPPLRLDKIKETLEAVEIAVRIGALRDAREIRKILNPIWRHVDDNISDKEVKELLNRFIEMNAPSRAEGDSPQARSSSGGNGTKRIKQN